MSDCKTYEQAIICFNETYDKADLKSECSRMNRYIDVLQITLDDVDSLNIIHVTGTKGKGSTCTFTESILRQHGYRTGCMISPHVTEVRERIRINGRNLDKQTYSKYFYAVHNKLMKLRESGEECMPTYFSFHVLMSLYVFLEEKVDVCVLEVGIGGEYDPTNFIRQPVACGVTHIEMDHMDMLGNTKSSIAWHKAGIFKPGSVAFTETEQEKSVMDVLMSRAVEKKIQVYSVPDLASYENEGETIELGISGKVQAKNASLALQLANTFLNRHNGHGGNTKDVLDTIPTCRPFKITQPMLQGLREATIMCRGQVTKKSNVTYYIDGAHTVDSIQYCVDWFVQESEKEAREISGKTVKVLLFNLTGKRDPLKLLGPISIMDFDAVVFVPNNVYPGCDIPDRYLPDGAFEINHGICLDNMKAWHTLKGTMEDEDEVFHCIRDGLHWATQGRDPGLMDEPIDVLVPMRDIDGTIVGLEKGQQASKRDLAKKIPQRLQDATHIQVFITGSLGLTGGVLKLIQKASNNVPNRL